MTLTTETTEFACLSCQKRGTKCSTQAHWTDETPIQGELGALLAFQYHNRALTKKAKKVAIDKLPRPKLVPIEWQEVILQELRKELDEREKIDQEYVESTMKLIEKEKVRKGKGKEKEREPRAKKREGKGKQREVPEVSILTSGHKTSARAPTTGASPENEDQVVISGIVFIMRCVQSYLMS